MCALCCGPLSLFLTHTHQRVCLSPRRLLLVVGCCCCLLLLKICEFSWMYFVLVLISLMDSILTATSCQFLVMTESYTGLRFGLGLFRIQGVEQNQGGGCVAYTDEFKEGLLDVYIQLARFFVVANATLTFLASTLWIIWHFCYPKTRSLWKSIRLLLYLSLWACGLTLFMYGFEQCNAFGANCVPGSGSFVVISNVILLILLSALGLSSDVLTTQTPLATNDEH
jgi:hypothetical protein